jgi:hypothetical protein
VRTEATDENATASAAAQHRLAFSSDLALRFGSELIAFARRGNEVSWHSPCCEVLSWISALSRISPSNGEAERPPRSPAGASVGGYFHRGQSAHTHELSRTAPAIVRSHLNRLALCACGPTAASEGDIVSELSAPSAWNEAIARLARSAKGATAAQPKPRWRAPRPQTNLGKPYAHTEASTEDA